MTRTTRSTPIARDCRKVALDASVLRYFAQATQLHALMTYLGRRAVVTREVMDELQLAADRRIAGTTEIALFLARSRWPPVVETPRELWDEVLLIQKGLCKAGDNAKKHLGEITTVLVAQDLGVPLIVAEDKDAKALARLRGVPRISTAMLAIEMHHRGALTRDDALVVYELATPDGVGLIEFQAGLARLGASL